MRWRRRRIPEVRFYSDRTGERLPIWGVRAGSLITATDYKHDGSLLRVKLSDRGDYVKVGVL